MGKKNKAVFAEPSSSVKALVLESMKRFVRDCEKNPFFYVPSEDKTLSRAENNRRADDGARFSEGVNQRLQEANRRRFYRYQDFTVISSR